VEAIDDRERQGVWMSEGGRRREEDVWILLRGAEAMDLMGCSDIEG
jgi:hypothetical protein